MDKKKIMSRIVAVVLALMVAVTFSVTMNEEASAAVKKPAKVTKLKVTEKTSDTLTIKWKKQKNVKYKVSYKLSTDKKWKAKLTKKNTYTIKDLEAGKEYNIKVRAYFKKNGKTYRGKFSKVISAETVADKKPGNIDDYKDALEDAGVPEDLTDEVLDISDDDEVMEDVVITDTYIMNGTKIVVGTIEYEDTNMYAGFVVVGDTVYEEFNIERIVESGTDVLNGQEITFKTGTSMEVPNADGTKTFRINDVLVTDEGDFYVAHGVTDAGERYYFCGNMGQYILENDAYLKAGPSFSGVEYSVMGGSYDLPSKGGECMYVASNHPDIDIYWTCDGTEPVPGQEDLFGSCRWTRNTSSYISVNSAMDTPDEAYLQTQLRGTTSYGEAQVIFPENRSLRDETKFWIKAYAGDKLIYEEFRNEHSSGFPEPSPKDYKQECIDRYNELIAYEQETYGPEF